MGNKIKLSEFSIESVSNNLAYWISLFFFCSFQFCHNILLRNENFTSFFLFLHLASMINRKTIQNEIIFSCCAARYLAERIKLGRQEVGAWERTDNDIKEKMLCISINQEWLFWNTVAILADASRLSLADYCKLNASRNTWINRKVNTLNHKAGWMNTWIVIN